MVPAQKNKSSFLVGSLTMALLCSGMGIISAPAQAESPSWHMMKADSHDDDSSSDNSCDPHKDLPAGIYTGLITFPNGGTESQTLNLHKDGSVTSVGRLEFPAFLEIEGVGPVTDIETAAAGQWRSNCDGTYRLAGIQHRQIGDNVGLPFFFGLTENEIPTLPNYIIIIGGDFTVSKSGKISFSYFNFSITSSLYRTGQNNVEVFPAFPGTLPYELQRVNIDQIVDDIQN